MQPASKKANWKRRTATAALTLGLAGGAVGAAASVAGAAASSQAPSGHGSMPPGGSGAPGGKGDRSALMPEKVTAVGSTTITVETMQNKSQTVTLTGTTKFLSNKKTVSLSSVKVGDYVIVATTGSSTNATSSAHVTASTVTIVPARSGSFGKGGPMGKGSKAGAPSHGEMGSPPSGSNS